MGYRLVICEDEIAFGNILKENIKRIFEKENADCEIDICRSASEFTNYIEKKELPSLIFMDISLGDGDGIKLIERYREGKGEKVPVIFVSSMEDRVLDGYDVNALAFLYKRNYEEKLKKVLDRFFREYSKNVNVMVKGNGAITRLSVNDIYYVESDGRKTMVHTGTKDIADDRAIGAFMKEITDKYFFEVYKSVFVNITHILRIDDDAVTLDNNDTVVMSRRKRKAVIDEVMQFMGGV